MQHNIDIFTQTNTRPTSIRRRGRLVALLVALALLALTGLAHAATWQIQTVDSGQYSSLALDGSGQAHISYYSNNNLKYATWDGSSWQIETVDSDGNVGRYPSLALDSSGAPHISYFDLTNLALKYAAWDGSSWQIQTVESDVDLTSSLALDSSGQPYISYSSNSVLKYAVWNGSSWQIETVDDDSDVGVPSLALDDSGNPHISYWDIGNGNLKYAVWDGSSWQIETVDSADDVGQYSSLALDGSSQPHISYFDNNNGDLKYAAWDGSSWQIETVDSAGFVGTNTSLALDGSNNPHISYRDPGNLALKYTVWDGSNWQNETVDSVPNASQPTSLALDNSGQAHISYINNGLKYAVSIVDTTPPVITPNVSGTLGNNGWYVSDVAVSWTVSDDESDVTSTSGCEDIIIDSDTAGTTLTCEATSDGGTASDSVTIQRDATAPVVSVTGVEDGVTYPPNNVPTASCDTQDALSGVATAAGLSLSGGDGNGLGIFTATCAGAIDTAGNTVAPVSVTYEVADLTPPIITPNVSGTLGNNGIYVSDVTVTWTITDPESTPRALSGCDPVTFDYDTAAFITCHAGSANLATAASVNIVRDATPPVASVTGVEDGAIYILGSVPTATCETTDNFAGVDTPASLTISGGNPNGSGTFIATCDGATDLAGNIGSASVSYEVTEFVIPTCNGQSATIYVDANNLIVGGPNSGQVYQGILQGGNGSDVIVGTSGNDILSGGNGKDALCGEAGDDILDGGNGKDTLTGGSGADQFDGGNGKDTVTDFNAEEGDTQTNIP